MHVLCITSLTGKIYQCAKKKKIWHQTKKKKLTSFRTERWRQQKDEGKSKHAAERHSKASERLGQLPAWSSTAERRRPSLQCPLNPVRHRPVNELWVFWQFFFCCFFFSRSRTQRRLCLEEVIKGLQHMLIQGRCRSLTTTGSGKMDTLPTL